MTLRAPTHYHLGGGTTACGLHGVGHRPIKTTRSEADTTCDRCLAWLRRTYKPTD